MKSISQYGRCHDNAVAFCLPNRPPLVPTKRDPGLLSTPACELELMVLLSLTLPSLSFPSLFPSLFPPPLLPSSLPSPFLFSPPPPPPPSSLFPPPLLPSIPHSRSSFLLPFPLEPPSAEDPPVPPRPANQYGSPRGCSWYHSNLDRKRAEVKLKKYCKVSTNVMVTKE